MASGPACGKRTERGSGSGERVVSNKHRSNSLSNKHRSNSATERLRHEDTMVDIIQHILVYPFTRLRLFLKIKSDGTRDGAMKR